MNEIPSQFDNPFLWKHNDIGILQCPTSIIGIFEGNYSEKKNCWTIYRLKTRTRIGSDAVEKILHYPFSQFGSASAVATTAIRSVLMMEITLILLKVKSLKRLTTVR